MTGGISKKKKKWGERNLRHHIGNDLGLSLKGNRAGANTKQNEVSS